MPPPRRLTRLVLGAALIAGALLQPISGRGQVPASMQGLTPLCETPAQHDARMGWWRDAKFGLFIHWGPVSIKGVEIGWGRNAPRPYDINGHTDRGADPEYDNLYKKFDPAKFNAKEWVRIAQDAGMKYLVLVCKHHDGFSMFHTKLSDYSIANTPFKRDIVGELADACHAAGLKFGVYYSQRDWYHPDYLVGDNQKYNDFYEGQVQELLSNYGKVDLLWFDHVAGYWSDYTYDRLYPMIQRLQPGILINNRGARFCGRGRDRALSTLSKLPDTPEARQITNGDFDTPEQSIGRMSLGRDWESCITICHQWSWKPDDTMKSASECIKTLVTCVTGGGNLLFNIGPMPTGEIEARQVERLKEMGAWLKRYGASVYGTRGGPYKNGAWGGSTHKGNTLWLHVFQWREEGLNLEALPAKVLSIKALTGGEARFTQSAKGLEITLPKARQDPVDTVLELTLDQPLPDGLVIGSVRSLFEDVNYGGVLATQTNLKTKTPEAVIDLGAEKKICGVLIETAKGKLAPKQLTLSLSPDGKRWTQVWQMKQWEDPLEISLSQIVAGANVLGQPGRYLKIQTSSAPLQLQRVEVRGKDL